MSEAEDDGDSPTKKYDQEQERERKEDPYSVNQKIFITDKK